MTKIQFCRSFEMLCMAFDKNISNEGLIQIYYKAFQHVSGEDFKQLCEKAVLACKFFPKIAELKELSEGTKDEKAIIAWHCVMDAIKSYGAYQSVSFDDQTIHSCINDLGGWTYLCERTTKELNFLQREFISLYKIYSKARIKHAQKLEGIHEQMNIKSRHYDAMPDVKIIGAGSGKRQRQIENK